MQVKIDDPALAELLRRTEGWAEVVGPDGAALGVFGAGGECLPPPRLAVPFTDAELDRRRAAEDPGRSLTEILRDLDGRGVA